MTNDELLSEYGKEICPDYYSITLEQLIESHRSMRETNRIYHNHWREEVNATVEKRVKMVVTDSYVLWSELEKMTLAEIAERISLGSGI